MKNILALSYLHYHIILTLNLKICLLNFFPFYVEIAFSNVVEKVKYQKYKVWILNFQSLMFTKLKLSPKEAKVC